MREAESTRRVSGVRVVCKNCKFYRVEGISQRCKFEDNRYENWLGLMYKEHPTQINLRGNCTNYEEIISKSGT